MKNAVYEAIARKFIKAVDDRYVLGKGLSGAELDAEIGKDMADLYRMASQAFDGHEPSRPAMFVSIGKNGVYDVSTEDGELIDVDVFVIDETMEDRDGVKVDVAAQDESTYPATVKRMVPTGTHFDVDQVKDAAGEAVWANGMRVDEAAPRM